VTESANSVLMFEAGEEAAMDIQTTDLEDIKKEFEKDGILITIEVSEKKVTFRVKGLPLKQKKCTYCDLLRGFFGGITRKHIDERYYSKKGEECVIEGMNECLFVAELVE
jgi:predicted hydrocarbon binding protein